MARVRGIRALQRNLDRLGDDAPRFLGQALFEEANVVLSRSKLIVPVDTGALRGSGHVKTPDISGSTVKVEAGYGGAAAPYATKVHERLDIRHAPPTRAKYLEQPFNQRKRGMIGRLARRLRREIESR